LGTRDNASPGEGLMHTPRLGQVQALRTCQSYTRNKRQAQPGGGPDAHPSPRPGPDSPSTGQTHTRDKRQAQPGGGPDIHPSSRSGRLTEHGPEPRPPQATTPAKGGPDARPSPRPGPDNPSTNQNHTWDNRQALSGGGGHISIPRPGVVGFPATGMATPGRK
jgi:hypothetical protein